MGDSEVDDEAFFAQMNDWHVLQECYIKAKPVKELRGATPRPAAAKCTKLCEIEDLHDLLQEEDNNTLEHLVIDIQDAGTRDFHQVQGFLEAAVSNLSSLKLRNKDLDEEKIRSFDAAIAAAKQNEKPIKLKTLSLKKCKVDVGALARSEHLRNCLERLYFAPSTSLFPHGLEKLLLDPACKIWDLYLGWGASNVVIKNTALLQRLRKVTLEGYFPNDSILFQQICSALDGLEIEVDNTRHVSLLSAGINTNDGSSKLRFLGVSLHFHELQVVKALGHQLLESPYCKLQGFSMYSTVIDSLEAQDVIVSSLEANYSSRIQWLDICGSWKSKFLEDRWLRVKYRNVLFNKSPLLREKAPVTPSTTKLFMCGHTGSGKTTISTNLVRSCAALWCVKPPVQDHASTVGIERRTLRFEKKKKILIYDLGGQEVYHAFHHYFIRGSDKDLFLVVCKAKDGDMETELQYWFRFIVAHQSAATARKPTVFLVLNVFVPDNHSLIQARATATKFCTQYKDKLNFVTGTNQHPYFEVNGLNVHQVQKALKPKLKTVMDEMLNQVPDIPWSCEAIIKSRVSSTREAVQSITKKRVIQLHDMSKTLFKQEKEVQAFAAAEYTLTCLHDMGEVVYFGADDAYRNRDPNNEEAALLVNNAVLDMPWFLHQVLRIFIPQQERNDMTKRGKPKWPIELAKQHLKEIGETEEGNIYFLLKLLCEMGVLIPDGTSRHVRWSEPQNLPKELIVPALLGNPFPGWTGNQQNFHCWGRRLQANDAMKDFVLLPSGVFAVIQAKVKEMCDKWGHESFLGDGWVCFQEDLIQVLVRVGGDYQHWTDRQWVDIMFMAPKEEYRCFKGEQFIGDIKDCITKETSRACPFIKLEEHVLHPMQVRQLQGNTLSGSWNSLRLQEIKERIEKEGFDYSWTWGWGEQTTVSELLMPSELNKLVEPRKRALEEVIMEYNEHIVKVYNIQQVELEMPQFESDDMKKFAKFICEKMQEMIRQSAEDIKAYNKLSMEEIKQSLQVLHKSLKETEDRVIRSCSTLLQTIQDLECPKLPHLTQESNLLWRYSPLVGKQANIHYLCEHPSGCHTVDLKMYKGVPITVPHEWFKKYGNILVPAITMCFTLAKLGKLVLPAGGELAGTIIDLGKEGLKASIDSCFAGDLISGLKPASEDDIRELYEYVKETVPQKDQKLMMKKCFGLYKSPSAWVCEKHHLTADVAYLK